MTIRIKWVGHATYEISSATGTTLVIDPMFAHGTAEGRYRAARALAHDLGEEGRQGEALEKLGSVLRCAGRYGEALAVLEEAAALYARRGDPDGAGRVVAQIGRIHATQGTTERGIARVQALLSCAPLDAGHGDRPSAAACELQAVLSYLLFAAGQYRPSLAAAARAADLARVLHDDALLAEAELRRGTALDVLGDAAGLAVLEAAVPLAAASGATETLDRLLTNIAATYSERGEVERSRVYAERALEVAERRGDPARIGFALTNLGETSLHLGDWEQARRHLERAAARLRAVGASCYRAYAHFHLGRLCLDEARWPEATRHLEECCTIAAAGDDLQALPAALHLLAEKDILEGHPRRACERVGAALARAGARDLAWLQPVHAWALLEMGETDAAKEMIAVAISNLVGALTFLTPARLAR
jgi:tetratricopeptide (TPR) repeat protein